MALNFGLLHSGRNTHWRCWLASCWEKYKFKLEKIRWELRKQHNEEIHSLRSSPLPHTEIKYWERHEEGNISRVRTITKALSSQKLESNWEKEWHSIEHNIIWTLRREAGSCKTDLCGSHHNPLTCFWIHVSFFPWEWRFYSEEERCSADIKQKVWIKFVIISY